MKRVIIILLLLKQLNLFAQYDICVYGGTSAGVIAAYTAAKLNKKVLLVEPSMHLGGLSSGGLGYTDIGNKYAITGLAENFYRRIGTYYGTFEQWIFEPHVAEKVFNDYISATNVTVLYNYQIVSTIKKNGYLDSIVLKNTTGQVSATKTIKAIMFIDCSYEGDLMAGSGVSYFTGRESNSTYNETWDGVQLLNKNQFKDSVDPYLVQGDSTSGLLWGISSNKLQAAGSGDKKIQAYNYRICLTTNPSDKIVITRPANYDSTKYWLLLRMLAKYPSTNINTFLKIDSMPNSKTDINNTGGFSTDMFGYNYNYPDGSYSTRQTIKQQYTDYTKGLLYFIGHDKRISTTLHNQMLQYGYPKDEYTDNNNWTPQLYIRESRRLIGAYVMTQANCVGTTVANDGIGLAAYTMDSHNTERLVVNRMVKNEGDVQVGGFGPYPISYRALIPKDSECKNLYVPVCLSASHIAYGSIRMEPVFMVLAESCAAAASMAIDSQQTVQQVNVTKLQQLLAQNPLMDGSIPEIVVEDNDSVHTVFTGNWIHKTTGGYGPTWSYISKGTNTQQAVFTPNIQEACTYDIYTYISAIDSAVNQTHYVVNNGTVSGDVFITSNIKALGQTTGEWISLGYYSLQPGLKASVTVKADPTGTVIADAVLFVPHSDCKSQASLYVNK